METTHEPKNLVLAQQSGIVVTAVATLALAAIKIYKLVKDPSAIEPTA